MGTPRRALVRTVCIALVALALGGRAVAAPRTLRFATLAPDGSLWAREARSFAHEVEEASHGQLHVKWYFGGAAGDERTAQRYLRAHKLDGLASGVCGEFAPVLAVTDAIGLFRARDESSYVLRKLRPLIDQEMRASGVANLGVASFGQAVLFSRTPVSSLAELQRGTYFVWEVHPLAAQHLSSMGVHVKTLPMTEASRAYDAGAIDGFVMAPTAALAFQWSTQARYFNDLQLGFAAACIVVSNTTLDSLPLDQQRILRVAGDRLTVLFDQTTQQQDSELVHRLFEQQGLKHITTDAAARDEFYEAARQARATLDPKLAPPEILRQVLDLLADYRAEQRAQRSAP